MAKKNLIDLEKDKFDNEGRVKVALDATADQDVVVKNTDSEPVPVKIINTDANIDVEVSIPDEITIDDSTPIDVNLTNTSVDVNITALDGDGDLGVKVQNTTDINVNVTNSSLSTNATIQNSNLDVNLTDLDINGRLPVSVDNTPNVNVTNSSLNTNATIQNASLDVNLTDLNVSSQLPVSVDNQPTVTVDDSTPVDINVTNASINTNATIQGTPAVTISGDVSIDDATAIRVDITNASIATNATIQNSYINVYDKLYDGSAWVNQLSDSSGKAIVLEKKYYSASDITALGSSTSVREWLNAYSDGILEYKYVGSYDDEFEVEVYLTHPDLGNSNKCLKLIYDYSTQNSLKVVQSVYCSVVDWTFDASVTGTLTLTLGTITSPDPNSAIAVGTDICTIAVSNTGQGAITISLSGTNASLYTLRNVTDAVTGSSLDYDPLKSYVLETASDFSGSSYSHSLTITATNNLYGNTDSENVATSGTYTASSFSNTKYLSGAGNGSILGAYGEQANKGFFGVNGTQTRSATRTVAFWAKLPLMNKSEGTVLFGDHNSTSYHTMFIRWVRSSGGGYYLYFHTGVGTYQTNVGIYGTTLQYLFFADQWAHFAFSFLSTSDVQFGYLYINGVYVPWTYTTDNWGTSQADFTITDSGIFGYPYYNSALDSNYAPSSVPIGIDEIVCFSPALDEANNDEITELYTGSKTGTVGAVFDYANHSKASNIYRHLRLGDLSGDSESTITCRIDSSISYDKQSGVTATYINNLTSSDTPYVPASGAWANAYYVKSTALLRDTGSTTEGVYTEFSGSGFFSTGTTFSDFSNSANHMTLNFWVYVPSGATSAELTLIADHSGYNTRSVTFFPYNSRIALYTNSGATFAQPYVNNFPMNQWVMVTVKLNNSAASSCNMYWQTSSTFNSTAKTYQTTGNWQANGGSVSSATIISSKGYSGQTYSTIDTTTDIRVDEITCWNKVLSDTEIEELHNSHSAMDPTTHSASSNLFRYIRFGDGSNDSESTITCEIDNAFQLDKSAYTSGTKITAY